jgi:hypothetical protein
VLSKFIESSEQKKYSFIDQADLAKALISNLSKNSHLLRMKTLSILKKFEVLKYINP